MKKHLVVLTGAGISAESGLQTFRDADGLWMGHNIEDVASPEGFRRNPALVQEFYNMRRREVRKAMPNAAHQKIADLEKDFRVTIITQNIDDLHERAGSSNVLHLHGEIVKMRTEKNPATFLDCPGDIATGSQGEDGSYLRPHVVWFGEAVPLLEDAARLVSVADVVLLVGSSLQVYPAAGLLHYAAAGIPKFIIDKKIPPVGGLQNVHCIEQPATVGIHEFVKKLYLLKNEY